MLSSVPPRFSPIHHGSAHCRSDICNKHAAEEPFQASKNVWMATHCIHSSHSPCMVSPTLCGNRSAQPVGKGLHRDADEVRQSRVGHS